MTVNSLSSSAINSLALFGLNQATQQITESTYRLTSGDRFYRAGDDIGALSISSRLQSDIVSLRQGQLNNLQAESLLQTAYSGASEINSILDSMRALAVSANVGSLTPAERATLDLEFQNLRAEIDSIANNTSFNNINLLDGSVSNENDIIGSTTNASQATGAITFTAQIGVGLTVDINGVIFTEGVDGFNRGASANDTAQGLFNALSASNDPGVRGLEFNLVGSTVEITSRSGGTLGRKVLINEFNSSGAASFNVTGQATPVAQVFALQGGDDNGLSVGSTRVTGTIGDNIVNTQNQTVAETVLTIIDNAELDNGEQVLRIDDGTAGGVTTFFGRNAIGAPEDFLLGATAEETLQNLVNTIRTYSTNNDYVLNQLDFEIQGNQLFIRGRTPGNVLDLTGAIAQTTENMGASEGGISEVTLGNGANTGVNSDGIVNPDFVGTIGGFTATYAATPNEVTANIIVGSETYTAVISNTNPGANNTVRFNSAGGGYFDVEFAGGNGLAVGSQADADIFAARLDAAFSTLSFTQSRTVTNFTGSGQLAGGSARFASDDFTDVSIDGITVTDSATTGSDAIIEFDINGETFRSTGLGDSIGSSETIILRSVDNATRSLSITNGTAGPIDLSTAANATTFEATLRNNFDLGSGNGSLSFQIGDTTGSTLSVTINSATSDSLFDGATPDLLSQANAAAAETVIDGALEEIGEIVAGIGSSQSRLSFAYNANAATLNELELTRSLLADTDIPSESTIFANAIVQQQAGIAVLAQTQALSSNLLSLLEGN